MKTTVNLPDDLFREAKRTAVERDITLTQLFEQAVRHELAGRPRAQFRLENRAFRGEVGLRPGIDLSDWARVRELIYEGMTP